VHLLDQLNRAKIPHASGFEAHTVRQPALGPSLLVVITGEPAGDEIARPPRRMVPETMEVVTEVVPGGKQGFATANDELGELCPQRKVGPSEPSLEGIQNMHVADEPVARNFVLDTEQISRRTKQLIRQKNSPGSVRKSSNQLSLVFPRNLVARSDRPGKGQEDGVDGRR
jgi:hypothetical protein